MKVREEKGKKHKKETMGKTKAKVSGGREEGQVPGRCQCGGLMVGVPSSQAISLCYQVK